VETRQPLAEKKILAIVQSAPKADDLPDVATLDEFAQTNDDRGIIGFLLSGNSSAARSRRRPARPPERVDALRKAFRTP